MLWEHITSLKTYIYSYVYTYSTMAYFTYRYSNIGVKQCDPSSSLLCLIFLNDIIQHINTDKDGIMTLETLKLHLLFFADDAVLFAQNLRSLQYMLSDVELYCTTWGIELNVNKSKCIIFEGRPTIYIFIFIILV